jgi:uncharacterized protein YdeI (YjbR/CyaY-like superfamily)
MPDRLTRPLNSIPEEIRRLLEEHRLIGAYNSRPAYQKNDYLGWIAQAKRPETRERRIAQMLEELGKGDVYMRMPWRG